MDEVEFLKKQLADARAENQLLAMRLWNAEYLCQELLSKDQTTKTTIKESPRLGRSLK